MKSGPDKTSVVVAGATGYVGQALCRHLAPEFAVIGLTRRPGSRPDIPGVEWRVCDLFSSIECEEALRGAETAVYLVHSMIPSAHLTQGSFEDMDLILADNFARAARLCGVRQIVYLGGLVPEDPEGRLSRHLESRVEVERTLGARGVALTALRASIVIGAHGSTFAIVRTLLARLRILPCPLWTRSLTQPIALSDVLRLIGYCLRTPSEAIGTFDIGGPEVVSYRGLLERVARAMRLRRTCLDLPFCVPTLCQLWLGLVTGAPRALVSPLVESLRVPMVARNRLLQEKAGLPGKPLDEAIAEALAEEARLPAQRSVAHPPEPAHYHVRSVQRLVLPPGLSARAVMAEYVRWLPWAFRWLLEGETDPDGNVRISLRLPGYRVSLLELTFGRERSPESDRQVYFITGGALARRIAPRTRRPRLEFREVLDGRVVLLAIHDYRPKLPPWIYERTQALAHVLVTRSFARHLSRLAGSPAPDIPSATSPEPG